MVLRLSTNRLEYSSNIEKAMHGLSSKAEDVKLILAYHLIR